MKKYLAILLILIVGMTGASLTYAQGTFDVPPGLPQVILTPVPGARPEIKKSKKASKKKKTTKVAKTAKKKPSKKVVAKKKKK